MGIAITSWTSDVARYVKGIDNSTYAGLLANEVLETARDFCRETDIWSVLLPPIDVAIGASTYPLSYPGVAMRSQVWRAEEVWYKESGATADQYTQLAPIVDWREDENGAYWRANTAAAPSKYHFRPEDSSLLLDIIPTANSTDGLLVRASLIPDLAATQVVDFLYNRWKRGITYGIAAGLMRMSNKPWTDIQMSDYYQGQYVAIRENAFDTKQRGANRRPSSAVGAAVSAMGVGSRGSGLIY
jgi:hypothetical protein